MRSSFPRKNGSTCGFRASIGDCLPQGNTGGHRGIQGVTSGIAGGSDNESRVAVTTGRCRTALGWAGEGTCPHVSWGWAQAVCGEHRNRSAAICFFLLLLLLTAICRIRLSLVLGRADRDRHLSMQQKNPGRRTWRRRCCPAGLGRDPVPSGTDCS